MYGEPRYVLFFSSKFITSDGFKIIYTHKWVQFAFPISAIDLVIGYIIDGDSIGEIIESDCGLYPRSSLLSKITKILV